MVLWTKYATSEKYSYEQTGCFCTIVNTVSGVFWVSWTDRFSRNILPKHNLTSHSNNNNIKAKLRQDKDGEEARVGEGDGTVRESPSCCFCFVQLSLVQRSVFLEH